MTRAVPHWTLDDIDYTRLDRAAVTPALVAAVRTAALVEANSADYVTYLHNVFGDDPEFRSAASRWGEEEAQHGAALGRWAEALGDGFDFEASLARFRSGYRLPLDARQSVRGSRAGELLARCVVESGTCSFYSGLRDYTREPVLRQICHRIAQDEAAHYRLFRDHYQRYPRPHLLRRLAVAIGRVTETGDDELAYAYYSANCAPHETYDRGRCAAAYQRVATAVYRRSHVTTAIHMIATALGLGGARRLVRASAGIGWWYLRTRAARDAQSAD